MIGAPRGGNRPTTGQKPRAVAYTPHRSRRLVTPARPMTAQSDAAKEHLRRGSPLLRQHGSALTNGSLGSSLDSSQLKALRDGKQGGRIRGPPTALPSQLTQRSSDSRGGAHSRQNPSRQRRPAPLRPVQEGDRHQPMVSPLDMGQSDFDGSQTGFSLTDTGAQVAVIHDDGRQKPSSLNAAALEALRSPVRGRNESKRPERYPDSDSSSDGSMSEITDHEGGGAARAVAPRDNFRGMSEYIHKYPEHPVGLHPREKPTAQVGYFGRNMGGPKSRWTTETGEQFPTKMGLPPASKPRVQYEPNTIPIQGQTTAAAAFQGEAGGPQERIRPRGGYKPTDARFEGASEARNAFVPHDGVKAPERMGKGGQESNIGLGGRFLGEGEHQRRYRAHDVSAVKADTKAGKPKGGQGVFGGPGARFDGQTTYGDGSGLGHDVSLDPEDGGEKAPARRELHAPFDGTTEYGSRYPQHPVELQEKMKTATGTGIPGLGEGKLKGHTEARAAFTPKKGLPPASKPRVQYEPNTIPIQGQTTAAAAFQGEAGGPQERIRPAGGYKPSGFAFEGASEAHGQFINTGGKRPDPIKQVGGAAGITGGVFMGEAEYARQFKMKHALPPSRDGRRGPTVEYKRFYGNTEYGDTTGKGDPAEAPPIVIGTGPDKIVAMPDGDHRSEGLRHVANDIAERVAQKLKRRDLLSGNKVKKVVVNTRLGRVRLRFHRQDDGAFRYTMKKLTQGGGIAPTTQHS